MKLKQLCAAIAGLMLVLPLSGCTKSEETSTGTSTSEPAESSLGESGDPSEMMNGDSGDTEGTSETTESSDTESSETESSDTESSDTESSDTE